MRVEVGRMGWARRPGVRLTNVGGWRGKMAPCLHANIHGILS